MNVPCVALLYILQFYATDFAEVIKMKIIKIDLKKNY